MASITEILINLYNNDSEVKALVDSKIAGQVKAIEAKMAELAAQKVALAGISPTTEVKPTRAKPGTVNHRQVIISTIAANPGIQVGQLKELLKEQDHPITPNTLATTLSSMVNDRKELRTEGNRPATKYFVS